MTGWGTVVWEAVTVLVGKVCQLLTLLLRPAWVWQLTVFSAHRITVEVGKGWRGQPKLDLSSSSGSRGDTRQSYLVHEVLQPTPLAWCYAWCYVRHSQTLRPACEHCR